jgi:hypothetical protein
MEDLRESDPKSFEALMVFFKAFALDAYRSSEDTRQFGLEGNIEALISLWEKGMIKFIADEEGEMIQIGVFNPLTGRYQPPDIEPDTWTGE